MKKIITAAILTACCGTVFAANYNYNGNGTDPNDWFDAGNWGVGGGATNWPTVGDNALFVTTDKGMYVSQSVPAFDQLQVGRGVANEVVIVAGGAITNIGQTISGVVNANARGALVVDGGLLHTVRLRLGLNNAAVGKFRIDSGTLTVVKGGGTGTIALEGPGAIFRLDGGTVTTEGGVLLSAGSMNVFGDDGSMTIGESFNFGAGDLVYTPNAAGAVSTIFASSFEGALAGSIVIDGTFAESDAEISLVLMELAGDTFSAGELAALNAGLELVNVASGSLSLANGNTQLVFTGKPVGRELIKAWEFNSVGDTEGWASTTANTAIVGVGVSNDIDGVETVLTSADITGADGQLFYNEAQAPGGYITRAGKSWRTMEIRLRQLDANPSEPGVASRRFSTRGTIAVLQLPVVVTGVMGNNNSICDVKQDGDDWVVATYDISGLGANDLRSLRIDPIGHSSNTNFNFEVDYVRLYAGPTQPPFVEKLAQAWEFNTPGDTEGWYGLNMTGVTAASDIDGVEGVMTSADVTSNDPTSNYTNTVSVGSGEWSRIEFRARQLSGNPPGATAINWNSDGTILVLSGIANQSAYTVTTQANHWVVADLDITGAPNDITNIRLDVVGGDAGKNFEIDYIRLYKMERQTGYEYWASLKGLTDANNAPTADPDFDTFNNFYEYAFGGNPTNGADIGVSPTGRATESGGSNVLEYVYYKRMSPYSGLTYSLEGDNDLVSAPAWAPVSYVETGVGAYSGEMDAVTNHVSTDLAVKFIRTKVE